VRLPLESHFKYTFEFVKRDEIVDPIEVMSEPFDRVDPLEYAAKTGRRHIMKNTHHPLYYRMQQQFKVAGKG